MNDHNDIDQEYSPIIGIICNPQPDNNDDSGEAIIYQCYVSWIEENGGKVVPIFPWLNNEELEIVLSKVNGVLMQGGCRDLNLDKPFEKFNKYIFDYVIRKNSTEGEVFPLWATCQGIELLYAILYNNLEVLKKFDSWKYFIPMKFEENLLKNSKMFSLYNEEEIRILREKNCTAHLHNLGIELDLEKDFTLSEYYLGKVNLEITTYASDRKGKLFIGSVEDKKNNIFATIFHPEMLQYSDNLSEFSDVYNQENFKVNNLLAKGFIEISKQNENRIDSAELRKITVNSKDLNFIIIQPDPEDYFFKAFLFKQQNEKI